MNDKAREARVEGMESDAGKRPIAAAWANFSKLEETSATIEALTDASRLIALKPGAILIEQGTKPNTVYLVLDGLLKAVRYTANGHEIWLSDARPGEMLGEISAFAGMERTSSVVAAEEASVICLPKAVFLESIDAHPSLHLAVTRLLARRLAATSAQMSELVAMPVSGRLHSELLRMGTIDNQDSEKVIIRPALTVSALGQRIHATREATSRALAQLEKRGLVRRSPDAWIVILPDFGSAG
jgi:CRP-like cAMP-binding protein